MKKATNWAGIVKDGLWDAFNEYLMGNAAEECAVDYSISRDEQDAYAIMTYERAQAATKDGIFKDEITPVEIKGARGKPGKVVDQDDEVFNVPLPRVIIQTLTR